MQQPTHTTNRFPDDAPFSFRGQLQKVWLLISYTFSFWRILLVAAIIGAVAGLGYALWKPVSYTARMSFVVEDAKSGSGGSMMSALAGQLGLDVGGLAGGNGILAGDNVLELIKSHSLAKKTLLSPYDSAGKQSLADVYASVYRWKEKWQHSNKVGRLINFPVNGTYTRLQDSLLQRIIKQLMEDELSISKPDKKLGFFELQVTTRDERLSLLFCKRVLKATSDFYIETKTRRLTNNVNRLQAKADSLERSLNLKSYSAGTANKMLLDINPAYSTQEVSAEITSREKYMQATIYAEIVKSLEMSKTALIQETPTVQIVDDPELPLQDNRIHLIAGILGGAALFAFLSALVIIVSKKQTTLPDEPDQKNS
jgi:hypothetical protein